MAVKHRLFQQFLTGNLSDKYLPTRTLLYASFRLLLLALAVTRGYHTQREYHKEPPS